jgi:hypothetical protein
MSIQIRKKIIKQLSKRFRCKKVTDLMLEVKLPRNLFENLSIATKTYVAKSVDKKSIILNEKQLLKKFTSKRKLVKNITPNGMIVPKSEISLEFNLLVKSYVDIIKFLNIDNLITNFHFPPNLRVKFPKINKKNLKRKHPTEIMHADTWTGANPNWMAVHIFILGDIKNNHIRYAQPPKSFKEEWLKPIKNAKEGNKISKKFKIIKYVPKKGSLIIADASVIHHSYRKKNAGIRISLDTGFDVKMPNLKSFKKTFVNKIDVKKARSKETVNNSQFLNVGKETYFHFPDHYGKKVNSKGGFKHPSNVNLIKLGV